jgi:hypothetical protein
LKIVGFDIKNLNHLRVKNKKENAGGTCAGAVGFPAHAWGEFPTAPTAPCPNPTLFAIGILNI